MKSSLFLMSSALAFLTSFTSDYVVAQEKIAPEVRFVASGIENARSKWQCVQADVKIHELIPKETPGMKLDKDLDVNSESIWSYQTPFTSIAINIDPADVRTSKKLARLVIDGGKAMLLDTYVNTIPESKTPIYSFGTITYPATVTMNGLWKEWQEFDPRFYTYYSGYTPLDQKFLKSNAEFKGEEKIAGSRCFKIELKPFPGAHDDYWIDVDHGFVLRRRENYISLGGQSVLQYQIEVPQVKETNGIWLPTTFDMKGFMYGQLAAPGSVPIPGGTQTTPPAVGTQVLPPAEAKKPASPNSLPDGYVAFRPRIKQVTIQNVRTDCAKENFIPKMSWPLGANIVDEVNKVQLVVVGVDSEEADLFIARRKLLNQPVLDSRPLQKDELSTLNATRQQSGKPQLKAGFALALNPEEWQIYRERRDPNLAQKKPSVAEAAQLPRAEDDPNNAIAVAAPTVKAGQDIHDFTVTDTNGKSWNLADLKGKKNLLLTFFPKCFTGGCANHLSSIRDHQGEFDALDTQILAVSVDPADGEKGQKAFAVRWQLKFPLIPDTQRTFSKVFGATQTDTQRCARMSVLIDKNGIVRIVDTDVHIFTHGTDLLTKMREIGIGK